MNRLRHQAFHLPALAVLMSWALATLTRIGLAAFAWPDLDHSPAALVSIIAHGALGDLLFGLALGGLILVFTALTHSKWPNAWPFKAKRGLAVFALSALLLLIALAEFVFWNEFAARFNFVAVDYLLYTREIVGNIRESYSLPLLLGGTALTAALASVLVFRHWPVAPGKCFGIVGRLGLALIGAALFWFVGGWSVDYASLPISQDLENQELAHNGPASFFLAFRENSLSFKRYYRTLPNPAYSALAPRWPDPGRDQPSTTPLNPRHVVVIQVESLSASFLGAYGNDRGITPHLDQLVKESVWFSNLYATGTRTVRGLEAMSAGLPPLPGESVVRQSGNKNLYTLGSMLRRKSFQPMFVYGGYAGFDNMDDYFSDNGYKVLDSRAFSEQNKSFRTAWGVADELLFNEVLLQLDKDTRIGVKRFVHVMTTSNHRPYAYPDGRIDLPSKSGRNG